MARRWPRQELLISRQGITPLAVIATIGSRRLPVLDPLREIARCALPRNLAARRRRVTPEWRQWFRASRSPRWCRGRGFSRRESRTSGSSPPSPERPLLPPHDVIRAGVLARARVPPHHRSSAVRTLWTQGFQLGRRFRALKCGVMRHFGRRTARDWRTHGASHNCSPH